MHAPPNVRHDEELGAFAAHQMLDSLTKKSCQFWHSKILAICAEEDMIDRLVSGRRYAVTANS